jgi:uncharacterized protein
MPLIERVPLCRDWNLAEPSGQALAGLCLLAATLSPTAAIAQPEHPVAAAAVTCAVEMVAMRDGVRLATEVYRPQESGKYPVILQRSPYNGLALSSMWQQPGPCDNAELKGMAAKGYAVILQDVRGTNRSEGDFRPIVQEGDDGYDTIEWAARQPWSTGKVGMFGGSYVGMVQWQAALMRPPHLVTITPDEAPISFDQTWPYQNGVFAAFVAQSWTTLMAKDQLWRKLTAAGTPEAEIAAQLAAQEQRLSKAYLAPVAERASLAEEAPFNQPLTSWYSTWLAHPTLDEYWAPTDARDKFQTLSIPVLNTGSFYDLISKGAVEGFIGMQRHAATQRARASARLVMAGGGHSAQPKNYVGQITFGPENEIPSDLYMRWFDYWLKGIDNGIMRQPPVRAFVMVPADYGTVGTGFWIEGDTFPLPGSTTVRYYPAGGDANTILGGGKLGPAPTLRAGTDRFRYDPANPVPTMGGDTCCGMALPGGPFDQRPVERRSDVLVYTSEALTETLPVIGNVSVTLTASTSAPRTAFTAKLVDVHPSGYAQNVSDGIIEVTAAAANEPATYTIPMNPTATLFRPGHRIRLEISSSNYPRFAANRNTDEPPATASGLTVANQTVLWGGPAKTSLNLDVAPAAIVPEEFR